MMVRLNDVSVRFWFHNVCISGLGPIFSFTTSTLAMVDHSFELLLYDYMQFLHLSIIRSQPYVNLH